MRMTFKRPSSLVVAMILKRRQWPRSCPKGACHYMANRSLRLVVAFSERAIRGRRVCR